MVLQIYGEGQQIWHMGNEWQAKAYVTNFAGHAQGDDISIVLALRQAKRGLANARAIIPSLDQPWQRKNVARVIRHFITYKTSLEHTVSTWPQERMRQAQEGTYGYRLGVNGERIRARYY